MRIYTFPGDTEAVQGRLEDETEMPADERLDALGWEIYLLARARGDDSDDAFRWSMEGTLRAREKVRHDFRARSLLKLAGEEPQTARG
jgi:hypothetical protein